MFIGGAVATGGEWSRMTKKCAVDGRYPPTREPVGLAYARTRVEDLLPIKLSGEDRRSRPEPLTHVPDLAPGFYTDDALLSGHADNNTLRVLEVTTRQRLVITKTGDIDLALQSCVVGDFVYLLMGGDMTFVLRKLSTGNYPFQGEAYVHGIVEGEFLPKHF